jgi:hypothetical protein
MAENGAPAGGGGAAPQGEGGTPPQGGAGPKPPPAPAKADDVGAGISALIAALESANTKPPSGPAPDPKVSVAFALGWQLTELYRLHDDGQRPALDSGQPPAKLPDVLPGVGALSAEQRGRLGLDRVDVALLSLSQRITSAGLAPPDTKATRTALDPSVDEGFLGEILGLHVNLLTVLMAADLRLGNAYALGRALADMSLRPTDLASLRHALDRQRVAPVRAFITDLTTLLPPHAGHSVIQSLDRWIAWAETSASASFGDSDLAVRLLRRQGRRWRAVLSGDKGAVDMLELQDYVSAGFGMVKRIGALTVRYAIPFLPLLLLVVALVAAGVALILNQSNSGHIAAGLGALLASAGITWKGVGGSLGRVVGHLERPLWEAELDAAIATSISLIPGTKRIRGYKPPTGSYGQPAPGTSESDPTAGGPAR